MNPTKEDTAAPTEKKAELTELQKYELMVILLPDMSQEETEKELNKIRKELKTLGGEIYHEDLWDVRDLAYLIKKYDKGYYAIFYFTLENGQGLAEMEKEFKLNHKLLRHLIVKSPKNYVMKKLEDLMLSEEDLKPRGRQEQPKYAAPKVASKADEKAEKPAPKAKKVEKKVEEKSESKPEVAKEKVEKVEEVVEEAPKEKKEEKAMDISELDSKLESILDDPDIDIKL